jgi:deoxyribodipyrimidine photo-lyase
MPRTGSTPATAPAQPSLPGLAAPDIRAISWEPTRAAGLARLRAFAPNAGSAYASGRNTDRGPSDRSNISALSPFVRHRLISEEEVIGEVLRLHRLSLAEKFVQEVCWRSYWKGWLQLRPVMLERFDAERQALRAELSHSRGLAKAVQRATDGATGIACFDAWADELVTTGWLHNHTRMWFASIWIFTLRLPWQLGADFFYKHLLDADPASNTLSWRWVAGLHTRGKHYLARAENIARHTQGRFNPRGELNEQAGPQGEDQPPPAPRRLPPAPAVPAGPIAWLVTDEDLCAETVRPWQDALARASGIAALAPVAVGEPDAPAARFKAAALDDGLLRAAAVTGGPSAGVLEPGDVVRWARGAGAQALVTPEAPTGLTAWALDRLEPELAASGLALVRLRRDWDQRTWPLATAGFFRFKEAIPDLVAHLKP